MIRVVKRTALTTMKGAGVFGLAGRSRWRHDRLLILGYHGIAQGSEHLWNPALFITPELLETRIRFLRAGGFNLLPLQDALSRLRRVDRATGEPLARDRVRQHLRAGGGVFGTAALPAAAVHRSLEGHARRVRGLGHRHSVRAAAASPPTPAIP